MSGNKNRRFYLLRYENQPDRPPYFEDLGNILTMSGVILQGMGSTLILMSPGLEFDPNFTVACPSVEEWSEIIRQTDDPQIFIGEIGGINKVLHRRIRSVISGDVQQKIWARDGFRCRYCSAMMGKILLTIDHFVPLELGGVNDESNFITACRKCNKDKGMMMPEDFCRKKGFDYEGLKKFLEVGW